MKTITLFACLCLLPILIGMTACTRKPEKILDRRISLRRKDKIPYGTYVAYDNLKAIFPNAEVTINRSSPSEFAEGGVGKKAYIIIVQRMDPDPDDLTALLNFVGQGNTVFISAFGFGDSLLNNLNVKPGYRFFSLNGRDTLRLSVTNPVTRDSLSFFYPGDANDSYFRSIDSQYTSILGRDAWGKPDFLKFGYKGGGAIYLHYAPMAFTNFFLLFGRNKAYYENALSYIPVTTNEIKWDEYFRYYEYSGSGSRRKGFSALGYILSNTSLAWAFWLVLLLFLIIYLFESKRRQRIVPVIPPLRNNSLDFVKTIGRLYYQRRDNHNLLLKMSAIFQDHVRTRYRLHVPPTADGEPAFIERLAHRTGFDRTALGDLLAQMRQLRDAGSVSDEGILALNQSLEEFYKLA
ncbi:MAG: hypothetical protein Q8927_18740 [Bacteroidota bacterium]|nr:hypothetical protein [Bacteroidota bacterium]